MGGELVTDSPSNGNNSAGGDKHPPAFFRYGDKFCEACPEYMSYGMTYDDFWDGDCEKAVYYRRKAECDVTRKNYQMWLQGFYIYHAIINASPTINPFSKTHEPIPYMADPIPLNFSKKDSVKREKDKKREMMENGKRAFESMVMAWNKKFSANKSKS